MERNANIVLGPRYALRLSQLRDWHELGIACATCGHRGTVYPHQLRSRFPEYTFLRDIEKRFTCKQCGSRGQCTWEVRHQPRD